MLSWLASVSPTYRCGINFRAMRKLRVMVGEVLTRAIYVCIDDARIDAAFCVDANTKFNVTHQAHGAPRFVEREIKDVGETGWRRPAGFQTTYADSLIFTPACQAETRDPVGVDIALD